MSAQVVRLDMRMPATVAARRAGVPLGVLRRYEDSGVVAPSGRSDRGAPLYTAEDIRRITAAHALETEVVVTADEVKRILDAGELVATLNAALENASTALDRRTVIAMVLAELDDVRQLVARRHAALVALDEQVRAWEDVAREAPAGAR